MYAIVDIAGQQFKVSKDQKIFVHRLEGKDGDKIDFDKVLLIDDEKKVIVGDPLVKGAVVQGKILDHVRGEKIKVFKKKRRKGYQKLNGHRQNLTQVLIENILEKAPAKKTAEKKPQTSKPGAETAGPAKKQAEKPATKKTAEPKKKTTTTGKSTGTAKKESIGTAKKSTGTATKKTTTAKKSTGTKKTTASSTKDKSTKKSTTASGTAKSAEKKTAKKKDEADKENKEQKDKS